MPVYQIPTDVNIFPHPSMTEHHGVLGIGGNLDPQKIITAYWFGIYPWYVKPDPVMWWYTYPRMVLFPEEIHISHSMQSYFNQERYVVSYNRQFEEVIRTCATIKRHRQEGGSGWIHKDMIEAYITLHRMGIAHSVEVWDKQGNLAGGLYGIRLAKIFFGESMFTKQANASKFGLISLAKKLSQENFLCIDCQQDTPHIRSMGGRTIPADEFARLLSTNRKLSLSL